MTSDSDGRRRVTRAYYASDAGTAPQQNYGYMPQGPQGPFGPQGRTRHGRKRRRTGLYSAIAGVAVLVVIAAVVVIVIKPGSGNGPVGFVPTGSSPSQDGEQITTAFLQAWDSGNLRKAAGYTDDPVAAQAALTAYRKYLNLRKLSGSVQSATATMAPASSGGAKPTTGPAASSTLESVTFQLNATVAASASATALSGAWSYHSTLVAYQQANSSAWSIEWRPDVVAPNLTASRHLAAVSVAPQVISVTDSGGNQLSSYNDPGLTTIGNLLMQKAPSGKGTPGLSVQIENANGKAVPDSQAPVISPGNISQLATTISPQAENAALAAVKQKKNSAMVVIQPSTGYILAVANNAGYHDYALTAQVAPGSDFKIITSTALINGGYVTANSPVQCPAHYPVGGITIGNDQGESEPAGTPFSYDFAQSCNNAFTQWWQDLSAPSGNDKLAATAEKYYGLNEPWDIGIGSESTPYFDIPANEPNSQLAEEAFGQGLLEGSPLAMASVAATVENGSFKQPIIVPGTKQVTATPLPSNTKSQLWTMMRDVITEGTAEGAHFGPGVYGKTGTADVNNASQPDAWFVAFDPSKDIAVANVVLQGGYGATAAAPEVKSVIDAYHG